MASAQNSGELEGKEKLSRGRKDRLMRRARAPQPHRYRAGLLNSLGILPLCENLRWDVDPGLN